MVQVKEEYEQVWVCSVLQLNEEKDKEYEKAIENSWTHKR